MRGMEDIEAGAERVRASVNKGFDQDEVIAVIERIRSAVLATGLPELEVRALCGEAIIRLRRGEVREGISLLEHARALAELRQRNQRFAPTAVYCRAMSASILMTRFQT